MSSQSSQRTFRLSFIRCQIISICQSRALRAALLAALNGGPDAALVVEMVERVRPPARLPIQIVTPVSQREEISEEGTSEEEISEEEYSEEETSGGGDRHSSSKSTQAGNPTPGSQRH